MQVVDRTALRKYETSHVLKAIEGTAGVKTVICRRLHCSRNTFDKYLHENSEIAKAYREEMETFGDVVESKLMKLIKDDPTDRASKSIHFQALKFFCRTKLRGRGYIERQEICHEDAPMMSEVDLSKVSTCAMEEILAVIRSSANDDGDCE